MAETLRVDVCYRPLRIGWAVREGDITAIRRAIRLSHALWGGRFNPILVVDREEEARQLVELFRVDVILPLGDDARVKDFPKKFPYLISPFYGDSIFAKDARLGGFAHALDVFNTVSYWHNKPEWKLMKDAGVRVYKWQEDDPIADVFLMQFGAYPSAAEAGVDYAEMVAQATDAKIVAIEPQSRIPADVFDHPNFATIGRWHIRRHYTIRPGWDSPGFFIGNINDPEDIVCYWNLRACDVALWFIDPSHLDRYAELIPQWEKVLRGRIEDRGDKWNRHVAVWSRQDIDKAAEIFGHTRFALCSVKDRFWFGGTVSPPMMYFDETSTLGVMGESGGVPQVNFGLTNKPFDSSAHFHTQRLVISIDFIGGLYGNEQHTFDVPYAPELNEFYARTMHYDYNKFRIEPERIGIIVGAASHDSFLKAMPVADLVQRIFLSAGYEAQLSNSGRILRQLMTQLGGLQGARVFKVPGARQLLKKFGPRETFSADTAKAIIVGKSTQHPNGTFSPHTRLFLGPRPIDTKLTPPDVFSFMVERGLFRIGIDLDCPKCGMSSWVAVDELKQQATCELCGHSYEATRQLLESKWRFRRSGVLGAERNAQGAVPVALTLQQLGANLGGGLHHGVYLPSLDLKAATGPDLSKCEVDFVWMEKEHQSNRSAIILAECKDQGPIKPEEFQRDVDNLRRVADALPADRFSVYLLFVKLAPFTEEEVARASTLNGLYQNRVILLTARELEPYDILERLKEECEIDGFGQSPQELADVTARVYFREKVD